MQATQAGAWFAPFLSQVPPRQFWRSFDGIHKTWGGGFFAVHRVALSERKREKLRNTGPPAIPRSTARQRSSRRDRCQPRHDPFDTGLALRRGSLEWSRNYLVFVWHPHGMPEDGCSIVDGADSRPEGEAPGGGLFSRRAASAYRAR